MSQTVAGRTTMPARVASCPVCGAPIAGRAWSCERCETPHHDDCARYFGGCAIYGCRDGARPCRVEREAWPRVVVWLNRTIALRRIQRACLIAFVCAWAAALPLALMGFLGLFSLLDGSMGRVIVALAGGVLGFIFIVGNTVGIPSYLLCRAADGFVSGRLGNELRSVSGSGPGGAGQIPRQRLNQAVPRLRERWPRFQKMKESGASITRVGVALMVASLLLIVTGLTFRWQESAAGLGLGVFIGLFVWVAGAALERSAEQLIQDAVEMDLHIYRFEQTYAPLPAGEGKPTVRFLSESSS
jgi:hypothetical protein